MAPIFIGDGGLWRIIRIMMGVPKNLKKPSKSPKNLTYKYFIANSMIRSFQRV